MSGPAFALHAAGKRYGALTALAAVSLEGLPGECLALVGHNGAGKTTLMKLLLGLVRPSEGTVQTLGADPASAAGDQARFQLGFLPETIAFDAAMTGGEVLAFYARLKRLAPSAAQPLLERVGLAAAAGRRVGRAGRLAARQERDMTLRALLVLFVLAACDDAEQVAGPPPREPGPGDVGNYCGMALVEHPGPKAQIFLAGREDPLWFTQVRDAIAFTRLPEEPRDITAIWVNDMGRTTNWQAPEAGAWADGRSAWFVIESSRAGGMGAPEAVPFGAEPPARAFATAHGGRVVRLDEIPDDYVLGWTPQDNAPAEPYQHAQPASAS